MSHTFAGRAGSRTIEDVARRHPALVSVGRAGWVAKGIVYALLGFLAVPIALDGLGRDDSGGGNEASQSGAIARIADSSVGTAALWVIAVGLVLYACWRIVSVLLPAERSAKAWITRVGYTVSAIVYLVLAWSAVSFALGKRGAGGESEDARVERLTRELMEHSAGRWLVGIVGVVVIAIGVAFVVHGATARFRKELEPAGVGPVSQRGIVTLGRVGWIGRGVMTAIVGWFLVSAAVRFDPNDAQGIDGALREATGSAAGAVLVGFVALGLIVYGAFCIVSAPRQRLRGAG